MKPFVMANKLETRGSSCGPTTYVLVAFIEHHGGNWVVGTTQLMVAMMNTCFISTILV